jgi:titin
MDQSTNETAFLIERMTGAGGTYAQTGTAAANATTYGDSGLAEGTTYFYRVVAVNGAGYPAYSNEASATTPVSLSPKIPLPPSDIRISP